jgi:maleylacetate reductase
VSPRRFRQQDAARTIVFGEGAIADAGALIGGGFTLLTTERAAAAAPAIGARAAAIVEVPHGLVDDVAAQLRSQVSGTRLVALGGGRVIDVAKALTAADPPRELVAIPTTVSAAEMTGRHRHARDVEPDTPFARASVIVNDPTISGSQPTPQLAASSANALGHAAAALAGDDASPIARLVAGEAARELAFGWAGDEPERVAVALGALLAGWAVDLTGLGMHHVLCQSAVRTTGAGHAEVNAALLPITLVAMRERQPERLSLPGVNIEGLARRLRALAPPADLNPLAEDSLLLGRTVSAALTRPEIASPSPALDDRDIRAIYLAAIEAQESVHTLSRK